MKRLLMILMIIMILPSVSAVSLWTESLNEDLFVYYNFTTGVDQVNGGAGYDLDNGTFGSLDSTLNITNNQSANSTMQLASQSDIFRLYGKNFTFGGWIYMKTLGDSGAFIGSRVGANGWGIQADASGLLRSIGVTMSTTSGEPRTTILSANEWYHFMVTSNDTHSCFWINGAINGSCYTSTTRTDSGEIFVWGDSWDLTDQTRWNFDEWGFWNRSLNESEINYLYSNMVSRDSGTDEILFTENNQTFSNETLEGNVETFTINGTYNSTKFTNIVGTLYWNNTAYAGTKTGSGDNVKFTRSLTMPQVDANVETGFHWEINMLNGSDQYYNSTNQSQLISNFMIDDCSVYGDLILNYTLFNEEDITQLDGAGQNTTIELDVNLSSIDGSENVVLFNKSYNQTNPATVCISANLTGISYRLDAQAKYSSASRETEFYELQNYTLQNSTIPIHINLYDLLTADSQEFEINFKDDVFLPVENALIEVHRKYVGEGLFRIVELPSTDADGNALVHLVLNDVVYNFIIKKEGVTLATFSNVKAVCQNPALDDCKIDFNAFQDTITVPDFTTAEDFFFTLAFNETSRKVESDFEIPSGTSANISIEVFKEDALSTSLCSDSIVSTSGSLSCDIGNSFGNSTVLAKIYKDGNLQAQGQLTLDSSPTEIYGSILVFLGLLVMMTLAGAGISDNPVFTTIFLLVGVILLFAMNLVANNGFIGATATILWIVIALILVAIKGSKRN